MRGETLSSAGARRRVQRPIDDHDDHDHGHTPGDPKSTWPLFCFFFFTGGSSRVDECVVAARGTSYRREIDKDVWLRPEIPQIPRESREIRGSPRQDCHGSWKSLLRLRDRRVRSLTDRLRLLRSEDRVQLEGIRTKMSSRSENKRVASVRRGENP